MGVQGRKWIKTTAKRAYWESKKYWKAYFQARDEHLNRESPTSFIKRTFYKVLERVDPLEAAAVVGGTILVHEIIFKSPVFKVAVDILEENPVAVLVNPVYALIEHYIGPKALYNLGKNPIDGTDIAQIGGSSQVISWLAAFAIAFFAVRHGDDILLVANNLMGLAALAG